MRFVVGILAITAMACGSDHGAPHVRQLPKPDGAPALRGGGPARSLRNANYKIEARLDPTKHVVTGTETLTWTNLGDSPVDSLPFHLYLNAFKNERSLFMQQSHGAMRQSAATPDNWGFIEVDQVTVAGVDATRRFHASGPDETVGELPLDKPLPAKASIEIGFKFTAQLPEVWARSGYKGDFHMVGQWFPKIGVRVGPAGFEKWECLPYQAFTEFFSDFGVYDVALTVPSTYVVAATGVLVNAVEGQGGTRTFSYHAEDVHDFAWMADPYMELMTRTAKVGNGTVEVRVYYRPEQKHYAGRHLEAAVGAIEKFSEYFEPYPWPVMTVVDPPVDAAAGAGGMEYPMFVTTAGDTVFARRGIHLPEYVTVHEVGHNWFQGMLASNETTDPWLDEGVNEWADAKVMADLYKGARQSGVDWMGWQADIAELRYAVDRDPDALPEPIATAAFAVADDRAYAQGAYVETMKALATLEEVVGPSRFAAAMKAYAHQFAFKHPTGTDLFATLSKELDTDLSWFFGPAFEEVGGIALAIRSAECRATHDPRGWFGPSAGSGSGSSGAGSGSGSGSGSAAPPKMMLVGATEAPLTGGYACEVVVQNTGVVHVPVDIELRFVDGSVQRERWDDRGGAHWQRYTAQRNTPLAEVVIDPDNKVAMGVPVERRFRIAGDGAAATRAASWFGGALETILQVVGP